MANGHNIKWTKISKIRNKPKALINICELLIVTKKVGLKSDSKLLKEIYLKFGVHITKQNIADKNHKTITTEYTVI